MPSLKVTVLVEQDGVPMPGYPLVQRIEADQIAPWNPFFQGAGVPGTYTPIPAPTVEILQGLILRPDATILVRFAGQTNGGLEISPGGLLVLLGCNVANGHTTNATVFADADANIRGLAAGAAQ